MGIFGRLAGGRRRKLEEFLSEHLAPGETIAAALPMATIRGGQPAGPTERFAFYGIVATDRALHLVGWATGMPERPKQLVATSDLTSVSISDWRPGIPLLGTGQLVLRISAEEPLRFEVPTLHRAEATDLVKRLRGAA